MDSYIGVDVGGTKLMIGEMDAEGRILRQVRIPTGARGQTEILRLIEEGLEPFISEQTPDYCPVAIGLGLIGRIDSRNGVWHEIDRERCERLEIARLLRERFGLNCFADNDVRSAAKAELLFGEGRRSEHFIYINIGTGIAAGFVCNGKLISGGHDNAGEVGHTSSGLNLNVPCGCGRTDCVEAVASGLGIDRCARLLAPQFPDTRLRLPEHGRVNASEVFRLYGSDPLCRRLSDNAAAAIANLIMNLIRFNDPDTIVLGGGVVADGFLYPKILERLNPHTIRFVTRGIHLTALDPSVIGLLGAGSNAIKGMEETK